MNGTYSVGQIKIKDISFQLPHGHTIFQNLTTGSCQNCKILQNKLDIQAKKLQSVHQKQEIDITTVAYWIRIINTIKVNYCSNLQNPLQLNNNFTKNLKIVDQTSPEIVKTQMNKEITSLQDLIFQQYKVQRIGQEINQLTLIDQVADKNLELQKRLKSLIQENKQQETSGNPQKPSIIRVGGFKVQQFLLNTHRVYSRYLNQNQDANIKAQLYKAETCLVKNIFENKMPQPYKAIFSGQIKCPMCQDPLNEEEQLVYLPCHIYHEKCFITEAQNQLAQKQQFFVCNSDKMIIDTSIFLTLENQEAGYQICSEYLQNHQ